MGRAAVSGAAFQQEDDLRKIGEEEARRVEAATVARHRKAGGDGLHEGKRVARHGVWLTVCGVETSSRSSASVISG
jgi:hypothetical protein